MRRSRSLPAGTLRLLDSIEREIDEGRPQEGLSDTFRRLGVTHVVVRNDLDLEETDAPPPDVVYASLAGARDLTSVASFGRAAGGQHPSVEVFAVGNRAPDTRVTAMDWEDHRVVQGASDVVNDLVSAGLVRPDQATVVATKPDETADILTDSNQRIERSFGRVHEATSAVMTADEPFRLSRPVHDYTGDQVPAALTVAEYEGAALVTASSSTGYADIIGPVLPEEAPYAAFDDSAFTAWATAPFTDPEGQWIEVQFAEPETLGTVSLWFDTATGADVTSVRLTTDGGSVTVPIDEDGRARTSTCPGRAPLRSG